MSIVNSNTNGKESSQAQRQRHHHEETSSSSSKKGQDRPSSLFCNSNRSHHRMTQKKFLRMAGPLGLSVVLLWLFGQSLYISVTTTMTMGATHNRYHPPTAPTTTRTTIFSSAWLRFLPPWARTEDGNHDYGDPMLFEILSTDSRQQSSRSIASYYSNNNNNNNASVKNNKRRTTTTMTASETKNDDDDNRNDDDEDEEEEEEEAPKRQRQRTQLPKNAEKIQKKGPAKKYRIGYSPLKSGPWSQKQFRTKEIRWVQPTPPVRTGSFETKTSSGESLSLYIQQHCDLTNVHRWMIPPPSSSSSSSSSNNNETTTASAFVTGTSERKATRSTITTANTEEEEDEWMRRTPGFLILGAKKGGTTGLFQTLIQHPQIIKGLTKELLYFIPMRFPHWTNRTVIGSPVQVAPARSMMVQELYRPNVLQQNPTWLTGEATPDYLLYSEYSAQAILCTVPWVKMIVLLRDPIERLFSHYNFLKDPKVVGRHHDFPSFADWVKKDIRVLQSAGVLPQNLSDIPDYMGTPAELEGWHRYQRTVHPKMGDRIFVRSLYALQLEDWYRNLRAIGRDPTKAIKIVYSSQLKSNTSIVNDIFEFLELPRLPTMDEQKKKGQNDDKKDTNNEEKEKEEEDGDDDDDDGNENDDDNYDDDSTEDESDPKTNAPPPQVKRAMVTTYTTKKIPPKFEKYLKKIFTPYNQRLYRLLGKEHDGVFDDDHRSTMTTTTR